MSQQEMEEMDLQDMLDRDYRDVCRWAYNLIQHPDKWVCLDTETTGLTSIAEPVQIAVLRPDGSVLMDTLVKPTVPVSDGAAAVHGITNEKLEGAPAFRHVYYVLRDVLADLNVVVYNAAYDRGVLNQACRVVGFPVLSNTFICAMETYAEFCGEWSEWHGSYRWQKLPGGDHSAIGDCRATLRVIKKMADAYKPEWDTPHAVAEKVETDA